MLSQCFNSDGSPSSDIPCDPNALVSTCCKSRSFCATNLFCLDPEKGRVTGSCSDPGWGKVALSSCPCPGFIQNTPFDPFTNVTNCVNGIYCCNSHNEGCCTQGQGHLSVVYDFKAATASFMGMSPAITLSTSTTTRPIESIAKSSDSAEQNSTFEGLPIHPSTTNGSLNGTATATGNTSGSAAAGSNEGGGGYSQLGIGVALGLGTPLLLILGACIFLFLRLRKTRKVQVKEVEGPVLRVQRSINTLREKRSMATLNEEDGRWI